MNYLPFLLSERSNQTPTPRFKFWFNGAIHEGLRHQGELFQLRHTFSSAQRDEVYKIGCDLEGNGIRVVITFSGSQYRLWTSLQSATLTTQIQDKSGSNGDRSEDRSSDRLRPIHSPIAPFGSKPTFVGLLPHQTLQPMQG